MRRIVVFGGRGFFGGAAVDLLRQDGARPLVASRRAGADLVADVEDRASLRAALLPGDVVVDAAGPFQRRSTALVDTCLAVGCDVVDLADSLDYVRAVIEAVGDRRDRRVLTACSSVSAVSAALVRLAGVDRPVRLSAVLAPATRNTSTGATAQALFAALDRPVRVLRGGALVERNAFGDARGFAFPPPIGGVRARLLESADAVTLPGVWPSLRDVDFRVDLRREPLNRLLAVAARVAPLRALLRAGEPIGRAINRRFGARSGGFGVAVEDASGARVSAGFLHASRSFVVAAVPAAIVARRIAGGAFEPAGLVPADRLVDPSELRDVLARLDVSFFCDAD